jgi:hypothetical protein
MGFMDKLPVGSQHPAGCRWSGAGHFFNTAAHTCDTIGFYLPNVLKNK